MSGSGSFRYEVGLFIDLFHLQTGRIQPILSNRPAQDCSILMLTVNQDRMIIVLDTRNHSNDNPRLVIRLKKHRLE